MISRASVEEVSHRPTGMTPHFSSDDFGLIEPTLSGPLWRRRRPGQNRQRAIAADAVFEQKGKRRGKRTGCCPFPSIFEIGNERSRHIVVGNEANNRIKAGEIADGMRWSEILTTRCARRSPFTATSNTSGREEWFNQRVNEPPNSKEHRGNVTSGNEHLMSRANSPDGFVSKARARSALELVHQLRRICSLKN